MENGGDMLLKEVFADTDIELNSFAENIEIKDIKIDQDKAEKGDLFFDLKGDVNINKLLERGVSFVVRKGKGKKLEGRFVLYHPDPRKIFAISCKNLSKRVCDKLKIIGITGTNGKTSVARIVSDILSGVRGKVGLIGTIGCEFLGRHFDTGFTTPDPHILHKIFQKMYLSGVEYVVMEVSAHSIFLKKLEGIKFDVLALTNITQDHLDFFKSMQAYKETKFSYFTKDHTKRAVICVDDENGRELLRSINIPVVSYGIENPCDVFAIDIKTSLSGSEFVCNALDDIFIAHTPLVGDYNVLNCLCAISITKMIGVNVWDIKNGVENTRPEVGRFNVISLSGVNVIIDYAHTPDGLEKVLQVAKKVCSGRLRVLFGCGGNRDESKRRLMGSVAEVYADEIIITSDNPRFEDPLKIIGDIEKGITKANHEIIVDRKEAIKKALINCQRGDCLIIAGKGGEKYQEINGVKNAYSDFDEVFKFFRSNLKILSDKGELKHGT